MGLWEYWSKHLRQYYLPSYANPPTPPLQQLPFLHDKPDRANIMARLDMLKELDRQVEAAWRTGKLKDDDRKQATAKVFPIREAKMKAYVWVQVNKQAGKGLSINEVGAGFRQAVGKTSDIQVELRSHKKMTRVCRC